MRPWPRSSLFLDGTSTFRRRMWALHSRYAYFGRCKFPNNSFSNFDGVKWSFVSALYQNLKRLSRQKSPVFGKSIGEIKNLPGRQGFFLKEIWWLEVVVLVCLRKPNITVFTGVELWKTWPEEMMEPESILNGEIALGSSCLNSTGEYWMVYHEHLPHFHGEWLKKTSVRSSSMVIGQKEDTPSNNTYGVRQMWP